MVRPSTKIPWDPHQHCPVCLYFYHFDAPIAALPCPSVVLLCLTFCLPCPACAAVAGGGAAADGCHGVDLDLDRGCAYYTCEATQQLNTRFGDLQHKIQDLEVRDVQQTS